MEKNTKISAVILAGGGGVRMGGRNKARLLLGGLSFLERLCGALGGMDELFLSTGGGADWYDGALRTLADLYPDCGAIGGIHAALQVCKNPALAVAACDMPLLRGELYEFLASYICEDYDAYVAVTPDGKPQPLCAVYKKSAAHILEAQIRSGHYRLRDLLARLRTRYIPLVHSAYAGFAENINTPEQYAALRRKVEGPPVLAVCGVKNSGKTTLLSGVIARLRERGLRVAVIKHDGHDAILDAPDTDSARLHSAGAEAVAVYAASRYMLTGKADAAFPDCLFSGFGPFLDGIDVVLLEGGKHTRYPKIEIVRGAVSREPVSDPNTLIALCTDTALRPSGVPVYALTDYAPIADFIVDCMKRMYITDSYS